MGAVYSARDLKLDRDIAPKFLPPELTTDPEAKQRFVHEAQAASSLQHTNICVIHEIDETPAGEMFIVMEFLGGESLKTTIDRGPLGTDQALDMALQTARGLQKAHEHGIAHRDVKPANVMVTPDGVAKIVDFGVAKLSGRTQLTGTGSTPGTAAYMSPEQIQGRAADHRTDIWALGVMLYEMLAGKRPIQGEYDTALGEADAAVDRLAFSSRFRLCRCPQPRCGSIPRGIPFGNIPGSLSLRNRLLSGPDTPLRKQMQQCRFLPDLPETSGTGAEQRHRPGVRIPPAAASARAHRRLKNISRRRR